MRAAVNLSAACRRSHTPRGVHGPCGALRQIQSSMPHRSVANFHAGAGGTYIPGASCEASRTRLLRTDRRCRPSNVSVRRVSTRFINFCTQEVDGISCSRVSITLVTSSNSWRWAGCDAEYMNRLSSAPQRRVCKRSIFGYAVS